MAVLGYLCDALVEDCCFLVLCFRGCHRVLGGTGGFEDTGVGGCCGCLRVGGGFVVGERWVGQERSASDKLSCRVEGSRQVRWCLVGWLCWGFLVFVCAWFSLVVSEGGELIGLPA